MFSFDNGFNHPEIRSVSGAADHETQLIRITTHQQSSRIYRQIEENILAHELPDLLDEYMAKEDLAMDAMHLFDPHLWTELRETYETHRAAIGGVRPRRTDSGTPTAQDAQNGNDGKERKDDECLW